jgi:SAM-dependent methyltransferase
MLTRFKQFIITKIVDPTASSLPRNAKEYLVHHALRAEAPGVLRTLGREELAHFFIRGEGIEIGALNSPLRVPPGAKVRYVDYATPEELQKDYPYLEYKAPDIVDDGAVLLKVADCSQDFVIACHVIEHIEDPIGAVKNWLRVLKPGGVLFVSIPDRRFTFDYYRPVTTWEHLKRDHEEGAGRSRTAHFEEFYRAMLGEEREEDVQRLVAGHANGAGHTHFHVWTQLEMLEHVVALRRYGLDFEIVAFASYDNEGTFILRKGERREPEKAHESIESARGVIAGVLSGLK